MSKKSKAETEQMELSEDAKRAIVARQIASHNLAAETLTGDIRDWILQKMRYEQDKQPWFKRSESEQRDFVYQVEAEVSEIVKTAVEIIAAAGQPAIHATLDQVTIKDGIRATVSILKHDPLRHVLADAQGSAIMIIVADAEQFAGERAEVEITPDQGDLERVAVTHSSDEADKFDDRNGSPLN